MKKHLIFHFCVNEETGWAYEHIKRLQKHIDLFEYDNTALTSGVRLKDIAVKRTKNVYKNT